MKRKRPDYPEQNTIFKKLAPKLEYWTNPVFLKLPNIMNESFDLDENSKAVKKRKMEINEIGAYILSKFSAKICWVCWYVGKDYQTHSVDQCPHFKNKCLRCLGAHSVSECSLKVKCRGVDYECGLPYDNLTNCTFHLGTSCNTLAKDQLIPMLMYLFEHQNSTVQQKTGIQFQDKQSFFNWIYQLELGITNGMRLFYNLTKD